MRGLNTSASVLAALAGCASVIIAVMALDHARETAPLEPTRVVVVAAGDFDDAPAVDATETSCQGPSMSTDRADSYRCFYRDASGSWIVDPCFSVGFPEATRAVCPDDPWIGGATVLEPVALEQREPSPNGVVVEGGDDVSRFDVATYNPWALDLANGDRCRFVTGVSRPPGIGVRTNYLCERGVVVGSPDRDADAWMVLWGETVDSDLTPVAVSTAWL